MSQTNSIDFFERGFFQRRFRGGGLTAPLGAPPKDFLSSEAIYPPLSSFFLDFSGAERPTLGGVYCIH